MLFFLQNAPAEAQVINSEAKHKLELGDEYMAEQRFAEACHSYAGAARLAPKWWVTHYKYGTCLELSSKPQEEVLRSFDNALSLAPDQEVLLLAIGRVYEEAKDWSKAQEFYQRSIEAGSPSPDTMTRLGSIFIEQRSWDKALALLEQSAAQQATSEVLSQLARLYRVMGKRKKEEAVLRQLLALSPDGQGQDERLDQILVETGRSGQLSRHKQQLGDEFMAQARVLEACESFAQAIELSPSWWEPRFKLGICLEKALRPSHIVALQLEEALAHAPGLFVILKELGRVHQEAGDNEEAINYYQQALLEAPDSPEILAQMGAIFIKQSKWTRARTNLENASRGRVDPVAWHHLANLYKTMGLTSREEQILRKLVAYAPDPAPYASRLGLIYIQTGRHSLAHKLAYWLSSNSRQKNRPSP
jgi:tetratricopeptide (TPR) repeat protein